MTHRITRAIGGAALALGLVLSLSACSGSEKEPDSSTQLSKAPHNDADVSFASDMLLHHAQALEMVELTKGRDLDPEVQAIADAIRAAQTPEIKTFRTWLTAWGEQVPVPGDHKMDMGMSGMMSSDDMAALRNAPDSEFQTMWLKMMVKHHTGAVKMATLETEEGQYKPALALAETIIAFQTSEIKKMNDLLDTEPTG